MRSQDVLTLDAKSREPKSLCAVGPRVSRESHTDNCAGAARQTRYKALRGDAVVEPT
jgi:hypothetical protein